MRLVVWLGFPVLILCFALFVTILVSWSEGVPLCATWLRPALPYCA